MKYVVVQKSTTNKKSQVTNVGKLLNEDLDIKEVHKEIATQIQQARNEHKLTQEQLGQAAGAQQLRPKKSKKM